MAHLSSIQKRALRALFAADSKELAETLFVKFLENTQSVQQEAVTHCFDILLKFIKKEDLIVDFAEVFAGNIQNPVYTGRIEKLNFELGDGGLGAYTPDDNTLEIANYAAVQDELFEEEDVEKMKRSEIREAIDETRLHTLAHEYAHIVTYDILEFVFFDEVGAARMYERAKLEKREQIFHGPFFRLTLLGLYKSLGGHIADGWYLQCAAWMGQITRTGFLTSNADVRDAYEWEGWSDTIIRDVKRAGVLVVPKRALKLTPGLVGDLLKLLDIRQNGALRLEEEYAPQTVLDLIPAGAKVVLVGGEWNLYETLESLSFYDMMALRRSPKVSPTRILSFKAEDSPVLVCVITKSNDLIYVYDDTVTQPREIGFIEAWSLLNL